MRYLMATAAAAAILTGCSGDSPAPANEAAAAAPAATLTAGEYEVTTVVDSLAATDGTTPATKAKMPEAGSPAVVHRACVAADGTIAPEMFAEAGDTCKTENPYVRGGRMTMQLNCTREGTPGQVLQSVNGKFTADSFEATVNTGTYLVGSGDYSMRRTMTGKRVGDCPAPVAEDPA